MNRGGVTSLAGSEDCDHAHARGVTPRLHGDRSSRTRDPRSLPVCLAISRVPYPLPHSLTNWCLGFPGCAPLRQINRTQGGSPGTSGSRPVGQGHGGLAPGIRTVSGNSWEGPASACGV